MENSLENQKVLLGRRIRTLRNKKGWTQQELGDHADINYKFLGEIERGQQNASFYILVKIAAALGVELPELVRFKQDSLERKEIISWINHILETLSDKEVHQILSTLRVLYPVR